MKEFRIQILKGKIVDRNSLFENLVNQEDGFYNVFVEKARVGPSKYFFYRDILAQHLGLGTRKEKDQLHQEIKAELLTKVFSDPDNLNTDDYESLTLSTKHLSERGWFQLNKSFELWAASKFDVLLQ